MYNQLTPEIIEEIKIVSNNVFLGEEINPDYAKDEMPIYGTHMPDLAVQPRSTEEVAAVMKICYENNIPVTPRGAGTGLAGGAVPLYGAVLIDISKMNKIKSYDMENFVVEIEAGVLLNDLAEDCQSKGMLYPPDPGEKFACVGGNVATNAGGMRAVKYGATRDYVRAMTVVLPTGEITHLGATVSKTSSGYSLLNLMIGSEGTLGIITELTLKIIPAPKAVASLIIPYEDLETALATVPKFKMAHMNPQAIEFMEREIVLASERYIGKSVFPQELEGVQIGAYLLVTLDGNSEDEVDALIEQAAELVLEAGAIDVFVADTSAKMKDAWAARFVIVIALIWRWTGYNMVFYLAGLQNIDYSVYEASYIDGASPFKQFTRITIPLLKPTILLTAIMSTSGTLQLFDESVNLTGGGPGKSTMTLAHYVYNISLVEPPKFNYAAAISVFILVSVAILSAIQMNVGDIRD